MNYYTRLSAQIFLSVTILLTAGCNSPQFKALSSQLLGSTGIISSSEADALFDAGGKLAKAAAPIDEEQEYFLGRSVSAMILSRYELSRNAGLQAYVTRVGRTVVSFSDRPEVFGGYRFAVLESKEINALSAPGGFVFISRGLLALMPDEDALAAVIAHEIGHIAHNDGLNAISSANISSAVLQLGQQAASSRGPAALQQVTSLFGDSVNQVFDTLIKNGYSRSQEYSADTYAAGLLMKAGYDPGSLVKMLEALKNAEGKSDGAGLYATHPKAQKRIDAVLSAMPDHPGVSVAGRAVRNQRFKVALGK